MQAEQLSGQLGEAVGIILGLVLLVLGAVWLVGRVRGAGRRPPRAEGPAATRAPGRVAPAVRRGASQRCAGCGLVNFSTAGECKRCGLHLSVDEATPAEAPEEADFDTSLGAAASDWAPPFGERPEAGRLLNFARITPLVYLLALGVSKYVHFSAAVVGVLALLAGLAAGLFVLAGNGGDPEGRRGRRAAGWAVGFNGGLLLFFCVIPLALLFYVRSQLGPTWESHQSLEGRFAVELPGEPYGGTIRNDFAPQFGTTTAQSLFVEPKTGGVCRITFEELKGVEADDPRELMERAARSAAERTNSEVLSRRILTHEGHPALEFDLLVKGAGERPPGRGVYRMIWSPTHAYTLVLIDYETGSLYQSREKFFDSFRLLTAKETAAHDAAREPERRAAREKELFAAAATGNAALVRELIDEGVEVNTTKVAPPLSVAAREGHLPVVRALIEAGADVNYREQVSGDTVLHETVMRCGRNGPVVAALLAAGANVNAQNRSGESVLMKAVTGGCPEAGRMLIEAGADPSLRNVWGQTPLGALLQMKSRGQAGYDGIDDAIGMLRAAKAPV